MFTLLSSVTRYLTLIVKTPLRLFLSHHPSELSFPPFSPLLSTSLRFSVAHIAPLILSSQPCWVLRAPSLGDGRIASGRCVLLPPVTGV